jgi:hypothetical protein
MAEKRAIREFKATGDVWSAVDAWAKDQGYRPVEESSDRKLYRKGSGLMAGARLVEITKANGQLHLEAWVKGNLPARILSVFILPAEITIESGGAKAVVPRKMGRGEVNALLESFNQPPIE